MRQYKQKLGKSKNKIIRFLLLGVTGMLGTTFLVPRYFQWEGGA